MEAECVEEGAAEEEGKADVDAAADDDDDVRFSRVRSCRMGCAGDVVFSRDCPLSRGVSGGTIWFSRWFQSWSPRGVEGGGAIDDCDDPSPPRPPRGVMPLPPPPPHGSLVLLLPRLEGLDW